MSGIKTKTNDYASKLPYLEAGDINPNTNKPYSWFGRAWRNAAIAMSNNIDLVFSAVGTGPIGNLLAGLIEAGVSIIVSLRAGAIDAASEAITLTATEQKRLNYYYKDVLLPTVLNIVKTVDASIEFAFQNKTSGNALLIKINNALQNIAALRLHGSLIDEKGILNTTQNYSSQVSALIIKLCDYSEKAIVIFAEKEIVDHKLVEEIVDFSNTTLIGKIQTNFKGREALTAVKKYVSKNVVLEGTQIEITDINTDPSDPTPATTATQTPTTPTKDVDTPSKSNVFRNILIALGLVGATYVITKKK